MVGRAVGLIARVYFDISYALLAGSVAGRRLVEQAAPDGVPVHGYCTPTDLDVLVAELDPAFGDSLLDLGCGFGGVAVELHHRSGAEIVGVDISSRAVAIATARARDAGVGASVRFLVGDLARPPWVGARGAYAIDSLMFVPDLTEAMCGIGDVLGSAGRLFATVLVPGAVSQTQLRGLLEAAGARVERLDNVTAALDERSRARARAAAALREIGTASLRGRLALRLVTFEEGLIRRLLASGRVSRWRFLVCFDSSPGRDAAHSRAVAAASR